MYSLVSAPVLGFDLTRLDGGAAVADVLLRALSLTTEDLEPVAAAATDDWDRIALWQDVETAARGRRDLAAAASAAGSGTSPSASRPPASDSGGDCLRSGGGDESAVRRDAGGRERTVPEPATCEPTGTPAEAVDLARALAVLERTPIGTVDGLLHCLRHDVLDWTWRRHPAGLAQLKSGDRAAAVLCDAAVAAYLRELLPDTTRRRLAAPWVAAARQLPLRPVDVGPQAGAIAALLHRVSTLSRAEARRLAEMSEQARSAIADWSGAVHSASWSVFVSGRGRPAAAAQLMLVSAVDSAGIPVADRAAGVWNVLSGAVQALAVRDVLDGPTLSRLLQPVLASLGPIAGAVPGGHGA